MKVYTSYKKFSFTLVFTPADITFHNFLEFHSTFKKDFVTNFPFFNRFTQTLPPPYWPKFAKRMTEVFVNAAIARNCPISIKLEMAYFDSKASHKTENHS